MIYYEDASKEQLLQICLFEDCPLDYKYEAAREIQLRSWNESYLTDLVRLWGQGMTIFNISIELGIEENAVKAQLYKHKLYRRRVQSNEPVKIIRNSKSVT